MNNKNAATPSNVLIFAEGVSKKFKTPAGTLEILKSARIAVEKGELVFITGKSGCGKSTFLHILGGIDRASKGNVFLNGKNILKMSEGKLAKCRAKQIGFVFQSYHLLPELTVYENVLLPTLIGGRKNQDWVEEVLKRVELWERRGHFPSALSGGEQQRTAIARALVNKPEIVLCDEPTGNLDPETADSVMNLLMELNKKEGQTFLIVTHDEDLAAKGSSAYKLQDGVLIAR